VNTHGRALIPTWVRLSVSNVSLELNRRLVADSGVKPSLVVDLLDEDADVAPGFFD
jgi:hypothetical protein